MIDFLFQEIRLPLVWVVSIFMWGIVFGMWLGYVLWIGVVVSL